MDDGTQASPTLDYETPDSHSTWLTVGARRAIEAQLWPACGSGLCVGVCFITLQGSFEGAVLHALVFAGMLVVAVRAGLLTARVYAVPRYLLACDFIAAGALLVIGIVPLIGHAISPVELLSVQIVTGYRARDLLGLAFLALAAVSFRHVTNYHMLAAWARLLKAPGYQGLIRHRFIALGTAKAVHETIWLGACGFTLLAPNVLTAVVAILGCLGYAIIWIWMIFSHAHLLHAAKTGRFSVW